MPKAPLTETAREIWDSYAVAVLPKDVGQVQWQETRRAFYAGMWAIQQKLLRVTKELPASEAVAYIKALERELEQFYADMIAGKA